MYNEEKIFNYLLDMQTSGISNSVVMSAKLEVEFNMSSSDASAWIGTWIDSFQKPECANCD